MQQITFAPRHHQLTNINTWTPDGQWLVFDVRPSGASFTGKTIERVNIISGVVEVLYQATQSAYVGVVTVNPVLPERYVFIHGPENPDAQWHYDFHHRRGVIVGPDGAHNLDAMDITSPFTPGALRGGSHVHVWSPDGTRVSFTYNDHVLHEYDPAQDLRNIGVALPFGPVVPQGHHPRAHAGSHWCALVSHTTASPRPGSDDINRAYEEGWIGDKGYLRNDGTRQRWALAFIGDTLSLNGEKVPELYIVDLPLTEQDWKQPGEQPLEGTDTQLPAPPAGVFQRRLTFTHQRRYPGLVTQPRHWVRSNSQGSELAFLLYDERGLAQIGLISPNGGEPRLLTACEQGISSAINWHPSGQWLAFISDGQVMMCNVFDGSCIALTSKQSGISGDALVFSPDGKKLAWMQRIAGYQQLFITDTGC